MSTPITKDQARRRKMAGLVAIARGSECPEKYRAIAEWWRLHAQESAHSGESLKYAENQDMIADDMKKRRKHHSAKPLEFTRLQWCKI